MRVKIVKDATVTVKAGQVVDIRDEEVATAVKLGLAVPYVEKTSKKAAGK